MAATISTAAIGGVAARVQPAERRVALPRASPSSISNRTSCRRPSVSATSPPARNSGAATASDGGVPSLVAAAISDAESSNEPSPKERTTAT